MNSFIRLTTPLLIAIAIAACNANGTPAQPTTIANRQIVPLPQVQLAMKPAHVDAGEASTITWTSEDATSCAASGGWSGSEALSNLEGVATAVMTQAGSYAYSLTCSGPGGTSSATEMLYVGDVDAPDITLTFAASAIQPGDTGHLLWMTTNATSCTTSGGTGTDGWDGLHPAPDGIFDTGAIAAAGDYSYTIACDGPGGHSGASGILHVASNAPPAPPSIAFNGQPTWLQPGDSTALSWTVSDADQCTAAGGNGSDGWSGTVPTNVASRAIGPFQSTGTFTYTLNCTGRGGSLSRDVTISVTADGTAPAVDVRMTASPATIVAGESASLSWTTANADRCTALGSWTGSRPLSGSAVSTGTLTTSGVQSYTLTCTGPGGSATSTATVNVAPAPAAVSNFAASPVSIQTQQTTVLSWSTTDATGCTASNGAGNDNWGGPVATSNGGFTVGPIANSGTYVYTLVCTGPGGTSQPATVNVTVGNVTPAGTVATFTATPTVIDAGQTTALAWSSANASSCTASGGSGADGWPGTVATASVGTSIGPLTTPGNYTYTLVCTGPGGASAATNVVVTVNPVSQPAHIHNFAATPSTAQTGQSVLLSWTTDNATSCTTSGGSSGDGWLGSVATASSGLPVGPLSTSGTLSYTLTCAGPGGTSAPATASVTVSAPPPGAPTVALTVGSGAASTALIQPGQSVTLRWATTNASSCAASGGTAGWSGSQALNSNGTSFGPIATPGVYTYTLTCSGSGGTSSSSAVVTVISSPAADCGLGSPTTMLLAPAASTTSAVHGICVLGCGVDDLSEVVDANPGNSATMYVQVGVAASVSLRVKDATTSYPAGRDVGFLVKDPNTLLSLGALQNLTVTTRLGSTLQETATVGNLLRLTALGLFADPGEAFVSFTTTKPFDSVQLELGQLASVLGRLNVYGACVALQ